MEIVGMVVRCHSNSVMASQALSWTDEKMIVEFFFIQIAAQVANP